MKNKYSSLVVLIAALCASVSAHGAKRGFGGALSDSADVAAASKFGWYYGWGQQPGPAIINQDIYSAIEYVPMVWGANYDRQALINYLSAHPQVKYLLGFNEPNFLAQSNLTPAQAAAAWPQLQAIADQFNLTIVGPALNFSYSGGAVVANGVEYTDPVKWYDDFFAACTGCRVDHIAIHGYFDNAAALPWLINLFDKYHKPIWLTEFNQSPASSMGSQMQFMREAVPILENDSRIFRYAWFLSRSAQLNTNLFDSNSTGVLTDLGNLYASLPSAASANPSGPAGYTYAVAEGQTVVVNGSMDIAYGANGNFRYAFGVTQNRACTTSAMGGDPAFGAAKACFVRPAATTPATVTIQAENYTFSFGVQVEATSDVGGGSDVAWIDATDWMQYAPVSIATAGTYTVQFRVATPNAGQKLTLSNAVNGAVLATVALPSTGGWQSWVTLPVTLTLPAGTMQFKITAQTSGFNINWFAYRYGL